MTGGFSVRPAEPGDIPAIHAIYDVCARNGFGTFDLEAPPQTAMEQRLKQLVAAGMPYLVGVDSESLKVEGFAYAGPFRDRPAYRRTVEDSIYLSPAARGKGLGRTLLSRLIEEARSAGFRQMVAVIGDSNNAPSLGLHRACGFREMGRFEAVGEKLGRVLDIVFMQRGL